LTKLVNPFIDVWGERDDLPVMTDGMITVIYDGIRGVLNQLSIVVNFKGLTFLG
jgi:hypothetical protein